VNPRSNRCDLTTVWFEYDLETDIRLSCDCYSAIGVDQEQGGDSSAARAKSHSQNAVKQTLLYFIGDGREATFLQNVGYASYGLVTPLVGLRLHETARADRGTRSLAPQENVNEHKRQVLPGDFRRKLKIETQEAVTRGLQVHLERFCYLGSELTATRKTMEG